MYTVLRFYEMLWAKRTNKLKNTKDVMTNSNHEMSSIRIFTETDNKVEVFKTAVLMGHAVN